jgi:hypothetical protein
LPAAQPLSPELLLAEFSQLFHYVTTETDYVGRLADGPFPRQLMQRIMSFQTPSAAPGGRSGE